MSPWMPSASRASRPRKTCSRLVHTRTLFQFVVAALLLSLLGCAGPQISTLPDRGEATANVSAPTVPARVVLTAAKVPLDDAEGLEREIAAYLGERWSGAAFAQTPYTTVNLEFFADDLNSEPYGGTLAYTVETKIADTVITTQSRRSTFREDGERVGSAEMEWRLVLALTVAICGSALIAAIPPVFFAALIVPNAASYVETTQQIASSAPASFQLLILGFTAAFAGFVTTMVALPTGGVLTGAAIYRPFATAARSAHLEAALADVLELHVEEVLAKLQTERQTSAPAGDAGHATPTTSPGPPSPTTAEPNAPDMDFGADASPDGIAAVPSTDGGDVVPWTVTFSTPRQNCVDQDTLVRELTSWIPAPQASWRVVAEETALADTRIRVAVAIREQGAPGRVVAEKSVDIARSDCNEIERLIVQSLRPQLAAEPSTSRP